MRGPHNCSRTHDSIFPLPHGLLHHRQHRVCRDSRGLHRIETQRDNLPTPAIVQALEPLASHWNSLHQCPTAICNTRQEKPSLVLPRATTSPFRKSLM
ncbi:hypothetical protein VitviT2T_005830 [Vitis vinifera]|uniref:Uncharacterized protein n=1 Tax=Vitis vinifera TaxID=29760 RepID=A0ABY9BU29_VITVI|nr:hypothetical protein VitviT2T_005830 [Vitis vinifera]